MASTAREYCRHTIYEPDFSEAMKSKISTRTLVIDDDPGVCQNVERWLSEADHQVATFTDPAAGLEYGRHSSCHLALIDLRMPNVNGSELIDTFQREVPELRLVAMTAFPETEQVQDAFDKGARELIEKPIDPEKLHATVDRQLAELGIAGNTQEQFQVRLGRRLRALRAGRELTLQDAAIAAQITPAQLSQIELGRNGTSAWTLARLASVLRCPLHVLFEGI